MDKKVAIVGYGALGRQLKQLYCEIYGCPDKIHFFDDISNQRGETSDVSPFDSYLDDAFSDYDFLLGLGYRHLERRISILRNLQKHKRKLLNMIAPGCLLSSSCRIGDGVVMFPGCNICLNAVVGDGCFLYNGCVLSHDSVLGDGVFLAPGVTVAGRTRIESGCFVGAGSVIANDLVMESGCIVGMATAVSRSLKAGSRVVGNPMHYVMGDLHL